MMQQKFLLWIACWMTWTLATGQPAQTTISMSDAILKGRTTWSPQNLRQPSWIPKTDQFTHVSGQKLVRVSASNLNTDTLDLLPSINENLKKMGKEALKNLPMFNWIDAQKAWFLTSDGVFLYDLNGKLETLNQFPTVAENLDIHDKAYHVAYTLDQSLWVSPRGNTAMEVARSEADGIVYGKSVHRDEFGIHKGIFWSNNGEKLAFYRMDERPVTQYPIYVLDSMPAQYRMVRYPFAGAKSHHVTIGIFDWKARKTVYLATENIASRDPEQYLTNIAWSPDDRFVLVAVVNRAQNHMWMEQFDASSGAHVRTIFEEKHEKYVEPEQPAHFVTGKNDEFLWESERDGFNHLYRYQLSGKMLGQVSRGNFPVTQFYGFSADGKFCFFQAADATGMNRTVWQSEVSTGKMTELSTEKGINAAIFDADGKRGLLFFSNLETPRRISVFETRQPKQQKVIVNAQNPLEKMNLGTTQFIQLTANDGTPLNGRLIFPPTFSESRQYPAIIYVYNGPHIQMVTNSWLGGGELWMHRMAQLGYVVLSVDGRGAANRGRDFENAIHRQCGSVEVADQLAGVQYLKSQTFIDPTRLGVFGWSYGGFMATSLMTRPESKNIFKCGVAGGPVIDWRMYEIMYTERYMDTPSENPEGYEKSSLFNYIDNLNGRLLMIHGSSDDVVLWQHSMKYIQKCVQKGKQIDYFVYPEHAHNVLGRDRVHLFEKIERFFVENL